MSNFRCDNYALSPGIARKVGNNGYAAFSAVITRAGVFNYKQADGSVISELRHPDDVFSPESLNTLRRVPLVTEQDHLDCLEKGVPVNQVSEFTTLGALGDRTDRTGSDELEADVTVYRPETMQKIDSGEARELSAGYTVDIVKEPGVYKGQKYHQKQVNIIYGHVAAVRRGRAGTAKFRIDSTTAILSNEETNSVKENSVTTGTIIKKELPVLVIGQGEHSFRLDSLTVEETSDTLAMIAQRSQIAGECEKAMTRADRAEGERDQLRTEAEKLKEELKGAIPASRLDAEAEERSLLSDICHAFKVDPEGKSNAERKRAICIAETPTLDAKRLDGDYLDGAFEPIRENWKQRSKDKKALDNIHESLTNPMENGKTPISYSHKA